MKKLLPVLLVLVVIAGGAWYYWTTTPTYAISQAAKAIKAHDTTAFHQWVDVHSVASDAVDDLLAEPVRKGGGAGILERLVGFAILSFFKEPLVGALEGQIDGWVAHRPKQSGQAAAGPSSGSAPNPNPVPDPSGPGPSPEGDPRLSGPQPSQSSAPDSTSYADEDDEGPPAERRPDDLLDKLAKLLRPPTLKQVFTDWGLTRKNFRGVETVDTNQNRSHMGLKFDSPKVKRPILVILELDNSGGHWIVTRISNLRELALTFAGLYASPKWE